MAIASEHGMDDGQRLEALAMECPSCGHPKVPATTDSTLIVAWYLCPCGHFWSARVRAGRPVVGAIDTHASVRVPPS
jgi:hypothetical protein